MLSNILLDDLDKELEKRSHCFCRYADDCNIYLRIRQSGERVMASLKRYLEKKLRLKVNEAKSRVDRPWNCKFLGYSMTVQRRPRLQAAVQSVERFKVKARQLFRQGRGRNLERFIMEDLNPLLRGWANYYRKATTSKLFEDLDRWIRRKLRCLIWRRWARVGTRARQLIRRGHEAESVVLRLQRARPVVECRVLTHERRVSQLRLQADGSHLHRGNRSSFCLNTITITNRRDTGPYVRWCGRTAGVTPPPTR